MEQKKTNQNIKKEVKTSSFKKKLLLILLVILFIFIGILVVFGIGIYKFQWHDKYTMKIAKIVPYPVALVNFRPISYFQYQDNLESIKHFYQTREHEDFQEKDTKKGIINRMIENSLLEQIAKSKGIMLSQEEIKKEEEEIILASGTKEQVIESIRTFYNWDLEDYRKQIIIPSLLKQKIQEIVCFDDSLPKNKEAKQKAEEVLRKVKGKGANFSLLAQEYSECPSASQGGDLSWFSQGQMVKQFEDAAFSLKPGEISDTVHTIYGYHIIKVEEREDDRIRARHILIKGIDFGEWLSEQKSKANIWVLISDFWWSKETNKVEAK